jgi:tetratricopeptide (TPR) repeat protein
MNADILYKIRKLVVSLSFSLPLALVSTPVAGFSFVPTELEYMSWSRECQGIYSITSPARDSGYYLRIPAREREAWMELGEENGGAWHYCAGLIHIKRAEFAISSEEKEKELIAAKGAILFSYNRIEKDKPWAADMSVALARVYRKMGLREESEKVLKSILNYHPKHPGIYNEYGMYYFDAKEYQKSKEMFLKANEIAKGRSSEIIYFLGLVSLELGELDEALKYQNEASKLGYPLKGLLKKIEAAKKKLP